MGFKSKGFGRYAVVCDDPQCKGCTEEFGSCFGQNRTKDQAYENGWYYSEATGKYACPSCIGLHRKELEFCKDKIEKRVSDGSLTREQVDNAGDPFMAAIIAMALGGDPLIAMGATMLSGSTALGIMAGVMFGDDKSPQEERFEGRGGEFGGGGTTATFDEKVDQLPSNEEKIQEPPVIAEPFEPDSGKGDTQAEVIESAPVTDELASSHENETGGTSVDSDQGTSY